MINLRDWGNEILNESYTAEEAAKKLKISKLTVYELIKRGELPSYRIGRQVRIDVEDLQKYIEQSKTGSLKNSAQLSEKHNLTNAIVISGQDMALDILGKYMESSMGERMLRAYDGSLTSLIRLYNGEGNIVSLHLFDGDTKEYNIPYTKRILTNSQYIILNLLLRNVGFYVQKGNPKNIKTWEDLSREDVKIVNREVGAGIRVLLDEQLRIHNIHRTKIKGYDYEESSHFSIATSVAMDKADVGIGIENVANITKVEFVPLIKEQYDLIILKNEHTVKIINEIKEVLHSTDFKQELESIGGYDLTLTGNAIYESF
ncbi:helix-turn-helix transcriptional regulator [Bacillus toyonensis]|uniref:helix-turn-helix transcriptional regulator n=1 Tax=Bacillus toyonensis TaxID=155322 RepID=UPI000BF22747|nr:helix-turn-helix transcriptional regulator [Bacillus toyonensis]PEM57948.1 hypothetical protein CN625_25240 [Bacillus toyonensis]